MHQDHSTEVYYISHTMMSLQFKSNQGGWGDGISRTRKKEGTCHRLASTHSALLHKVQSLKAQPSFGVRGISEISPRPDTFTPKEAAFHCKEVKEPTKSGERYRV